MGLGQEGLVSLTFLNYSVDFHRVLHVLLVRLLLDAFFWRAKFQWRHHRRKLESLWIETNCLLSSFEREACIGEVGTGWCVFFFVS